MANKVTLVFAGDSKSLEGSFASLSGEADKTRGRFDKLRTGAKVLATAVLAGLGVAFKVGFDELRDSQKVAAQTEAVLKSTGGAAKVTADQVSDLAGALMRKSGVDDEVIQSGANVLLTFTKIRNEVGKGNNIFDRATQAALDMSVALGTDMSSASILVGKALNDPIRGLTALGRSGIQFTAAQRDAIKAMVDSGNTAGAQKKILKELERQFGGSAAAAGGTLAGQLNVAQQTFNNLAGSIVGAVLPAFTGFAGVLNTVLAWLTRHETTAKVLIGVLGGLAAGVFAVNTAVKVWTASQIVLNAVLSANPVGAIVLAVAALAAGVVVAYKNSETFRNIVKHAFDVVKVAVQAVASAVEAVVDAVAAAKDSSAVKAIGAVFGAQFAVARAAVQGVITAVNTLISAIQSAISWVKQLSGNSERAHSQARALRSFGGAGGGVRRGASGGLFKTATELIVGEAGDELLLPLSRPERTRELLAEHGVAGAGATVYVAQMVVQDATDVDRVASRLSRQLLMAGAA